MTTSLIGIKKTKSDLTFTKAKQIPDCLILLIDSLVNKKIKIIVSCNDGNLNKLITSSFTSTSTSSSISTSSIIIFTSNSTFKVDKKHKKAIKKYNNLIKNLDLGFVIPLNVDKNIEGLQKKIKIYKKNISNYPINNYFRINNTKNNFIYQLINNELYVLSIIIKDFFNKNAFFKENRNQLFQKITKNLNYIANNFKNIIIDLNTKNIRNTYTIYGGCMTMQEHNKYNLPTNEEKYCHVAKFIQNYMQEHFINFEKIKNKSNILYNYFQNNKEFHQEVEIGKIHFQEILKSQDKYEFYLYLKDELFSSIIDLEFMIKNLIKINYMMILI